MGKCVAPSDRLPPRTGIRLPLSCSWSCSVSALTDASVGFGRKPPSNSFSAPSGALPSRFGRPCIAQSPICLKKDLVEATGDIVRR